MAHHRLVINNNPYVLRNAEDREDVAAALVAAVRAGGDLVHIPGDELETDVLVTPASDARLELVEGAVGRAPSSIDLDFDWIEFDRG
jgi:hypothetical protein